MKNYPLYETTVFEDFRIMTENAAKKFGDKTAFGFREKPTDKEAKTVSYNDVRRDVRDFGTELISMGLESKHCAIIGCNSLGWIYSYFALMSIGAVTVPIDKEMPAEDIAVIIDKSESYAVFYTADIADKIDYIKANCAPKLYVCIKGEAREGDLSIDDLIAKGAEKYAAGDNSYYDYKIDPDRLATIVFTSGTTGNGKGVMLTQTNIVSDMTQGMYNFAITPKTMLILPLHHTFGSTVNLVGHFAQGSEVYISNGIKYFMKEMAIEKPTHMILVPLFIETIYKRILASAEKSGRLEKIKTGIKLSNMLRKIGIDKRRKIFAEIHATFGGELTMIICGGAALSQNIIDFFDGIGITLLNGYGITECAPLISCNRNKLQKNGSVGTPIIGEQVKIADPDENGEGEICVKGPNVMMGYYKNPEETSKVFDEDGFFKTGDLGKLDKDGWLYITGRLKNLIIFSNGKNVYPEEIEQKLQSIYGISEVVVYAGESRSDKSKEIIVAEIFPDYEALELHNIKGADEIKKYFDEEVKKANTQMVSYKAVGLVKIREEEFYKNTSRKIIRYKIDKTID